MSDLETKLSPSRPSLLEGGARRTRKSLDEAGAVDLGGGRLSICPMDHESVWEHRSGTGKEAVYECVGERLVSGTESQREGQ